MPAPKAGCRGRKVRLKGKGTAGTATGTQAHSRFRSIMAPRLSAAQKMLPVGRHFFNARSNRISATAQVKPAAPTRIGPLSRGNRCSIPGWTKGQSGREEWLRFSSNADNGTGCHCADLIQLAVCTLNRAVPRPIAGRQAILQTVQIPPRTNKTTNFRASRTSVNMLLLRPRCSLLSTRLTEARPFRKLILTILQQRQSTAGLPPTQSRSTRRQAKRQSPQ
jgi:hypothetical protein